MPVVITTTTATPATTSATTTARRTGATTPTTIAPGARSTRTSGAASRYQAEAASWQSLRSVNWGSGWSGTGWLTGWDQPGYVDWAIEAPAAGTYTVSFHYLAPFLPAKLDVTVNGAKVTTLGFATTPIVGGDWTSWVPARDASVTVTLPAGTSHLRLVRPAGAPAGVSLDYVDVARA